MNEWIEIKTHIPTPEEAAIYGDEYSFIYDCQMPNDGVDVLITTKYGYVATSIYDSDCGCFEGYEDEGEVVAWRYLPGPYSKVREE